MCVCLSVCECLCFAGFMGLVTGVSENQGRPTRISYRDPAWSSTLLIKKLLADLSLSGVWDCRATDSELGFGLSTTTQTQAKQ